MTSKERFLKAINLEKPDRLPVTTHHLMPSFLEKPMNGMSDDEFFDHFSLDPVRWIMEYTCDSSKGEYPDPLTTDLDFFNIKRIASDNWRFQLEKIDDEKYETVRFNIFTPEKTLTMLLQSDGYTTWVSEHLIKEKNDIEIIAKYMTHPECDVDTINKAAVKYDSRGLLRGHICGFDGYGQPGCWQDFACMYGIENLIMATFEDPGWVHTFLEVLQERKKVYINSLKGAKYDLIELGGGDASTTVISPQIFNDFVAPYDSVLIEEAHKAGQRIVYHICGGMMPILEDIAAMEPEAMETFTPSGMGGDTLLGEAKKRIGSKVCMIGGFDQFHYFTGCTPDQTKAEVRRCFEEAGENGGYILSPSDHFFEADVELIMAYSEAARSCTY
ncbi:MAG: hypothetical protein GY863_24320 [bacterium]|nr:hypothetical protein [bacterium]